MERVFGFESLLFVDLLCDVLLLLIKKPLDFHPEFTWVVFGLYSGTLALHDYSTNVITILCRRASGPSRHLFSQLEQLGLYLKIIGLYADLMIFM